MASRLFNIILAVSSVTTAFTTLPNGHSSSAFATRNSRRGPLHIMSASLFSENEYPDEGSDGLEGFDDTGLLDSPTKFVTGDDLHILRRQVLKLRAQLMDSVQSDPRKQLELQRAILRAQQMDAEFVYAVSLERMETAEARGRFVEAEQWRLEAEEARAALPQFNLDGLWVGKYGEAGYEMINITYVGDTLLAHKVTGDKNVPKGELSFSVDLSPKNDGDLLEPVELGDIAAHQWGSKYLSRFSGKGQVAGEGFVNSQFIEGQLILVNEFFSFAWVPIGHQVFFGRPSAELTLKLLRASEEATTSDIEKAREHLKRCMEETEHIQEEVVDGSLVTQQEYYGVEGYFD